MSENNNLQLTQAIARANTIRGVFLCIGAVLGATFPDVDQYLRVFSFIQHRSLLTHGIILPVLFSLLWHYRPRVWLRGLLIGFCATEAVHLCFDLFPRAWKGAALIYAPWYGWTPAWFSWLWIAMSIVGCAYLAGLLITTLVDMIMTLLGIGVAFLAASANEPSFWPFWALVIALGIVWLVDRQLMRIIHRDKDEFLHRF